jgi:hypothetical protein
MRYLLIFMLCVGIFVLGKRSCHFSMFGVAGKGPVKTEARTVDAFHAIEVEFSGDVEVTTAEQNSVEVQAQENLMQHIKTEVSNGVLRIYFDTQIAHTENLVVRVAAPVFDALSLGGSGSINMKNMLKSDKLKLAIGGSGDINADQLEVGALLTEISGSGSIRVGGKANELKAEVGGSGDIQADKLNSNTCNASVTGSGSIDCGMVQQQLDAAVTGSGDIRYSGTPKTNVDITGSGSVKGK